MATHFLSTQEIFAHYASILYIPLCTEKKNYLGKICKNLEMDIKMYSTVSPKFVFKKIKYKVVHYMHYIQHNFHLTMPRAY